MQNVSFRCPQLHTILLLAPITGYNKENTVVPKNNTFNSKWGTNKPNSTTKYTGIKVIRKKPVIQRKKPLEINELDKNDNKFHN